MVVSLKALQQIPSDKNHSCSPSDFRLEVHVSQEIRETDFFLDMIGLGRWDDGTFNFFVGRRGCVHGVLKNRANLGAAKIMRHWPPQQSTPNSVVAALKLRRC